MNLANSDGNTALMVVSVRRVIFGTDEREMNRFISTKFLLHSGAKVNTRNSRSENALQHLLRPTGTDIFRFLFAAYEEERQDVKTDADICRLLFAAGETLDGIPDAKIPDYLKFDDDVKLELKHICREAIRKHLLSLDPHTHLFGRVPRLELPSLLTEYLLYNQTLDDHVNSENTDDKSEESKIKSNELGKASTKC